MNNSAEQGHLEAGQIEAEHSKMHGLFLPLDELKLLFSAIKPHEETLPPDAESVLIKIERVLYDHLTIREIELLSRGE